MVHIYTLFQEIFQAVTHLLPLHSNTFVTSQYLKIYPKYVIICKSKRYIYNNFFVCILQKSPVTSQSVFAYSQTALAVDMWLNRPEILECQTTRLRSILSKKRFCTWPENPDTFITSYLWCCTWSFQLLYFHFLVVQRLIWSMFTGSRLISTATSCCFFSSLVLQRVNEPTRQDSHRIPQKTKRNLNLFGFFDFKAYSGKQANDIQWECPFTGCFTELKTWKSILISDTS